MSYNSLGFNIAQKVIANCDKLSANSAGSVALSPWGTFRLYKSGKRGRFYSVSGSKFFHNGGSLKIGTIRNLIFSVFYK